MSPSDPSHSSSRNLFRRADEKSERATREGGEQAYIMGNAHINSQTKTPGTGLYPVLSYILCILVVLLNGIPKSEMSGSLILMPFRELFFCCWFVLFNFDVMAFF